MQLMVKGKLGWQLRLHYSGNFVLIGLICKGGGGAQPSFLPLARHAK